MNSFLLLRLQQKPWPPSSSTLDQRPYLHILRQKIDLWLHTCIYDRDIVFTVIHNADASELSCAFIPDGKGCGRLSFNDQRANLGE